MEAVGIVSHSGAGVLWIDKKLGKMITPKAIAAWVSRREDKDLAKRPLGGKKIAWGGKTLT